MRKRPSIRETISRIDFGLWLFIGFILCLVLLFFIGVYYDDSHHEIHAKEYKQIAEWCELYPAIREEITEELKDGKITKQEYAGIEKKCITHYKRSK